VSSSRREQLFGIKKQKKKFPWNKKSFNKNLRTQMSRSDRQQLIGTKISGIDRSG
jgi:hypothetical protein